MTTWCFLSKLDTAAARLTDWPTDQPTDQPTDWLTNQSVYKCLVIWKWQSIDACNMGVVIAEEIGSPNAQCCQAILDQRLHLLSIHHTDIMPSSSELWIMLNMDEVWTIPNRIMPLIFCLCEVISLKLDKIEAVQNKTCTKLSRDNPLYSIQIASSKFVNPLWAVHTGPRLHYDNDKLGEMS